MTDGGEQHGLITQEEDAATGESVKENTRTDIPAFCSTGHLLFSPCRCWDSEGTNFEHLWHHSYMEMANGICAMLNEQFWELFWVFGWALAERAALLFFLFFLVSLGFTTNV